MGIVRIRENGGDWRERDRVRGKSLVNAWSGYLGRIPWEWSATLTHDTKRVFPVPRDLASEEAFWWLHVVARVYRRPVAWAYVVEQSRGGLWHSHALLANVGRPNWKVLEGVWRMRNGYAVIKPVRDVKGIALYTTKQATDGEVVLSDTVTLTRFKHLASGIEVPLVREDE